MELKCMSFEQLAVRIKERKSRIVMFGAGVVGMITVPSILRQYNLLESIECYIDNDESKWNSELEIYGKELLIKPIDYLKYCEENVVVLINISRYSDALKQLDAMECTKNVECYLTPMLCIHDFCMHESEGKAIMTNCQVIPKKIHYMWLGKKSMPDNLKRCVETWHKYCPDYEIIEWNENNYDLTKHPYMLEAYENGGYGFVPDYARLDILYNEGGIYLDTDVELIRNIDSLLYQEAFCGVEKWQVVNFGGCSGSVKGHPIIKRFLDARRTVHFVDVTGKLNRNTCGFYDTKVILDAGYVMNGTVQNVKGLNVFSYDYFHPYDYMSGITNITKNTYSIHRFNGGWMDKEMRLENTRSQEQYTKIYDKCVEKNKR